MPDYNIYIHAIGTGSDSSYNPTTPWSARDGGGQSQTTSQSSGGAGNIGGGIARTIIRASSFMQNPDSIISQAVTAIGKAFPIAAVAYAVIKLGESIIDTAVDFGTLETGDHRSQIGWQNFKNGVKLIFHPISSAITSHKTELEWKLQSQRAKQQRDLLGDSVINSYTNRGV